MEELYVCYCHINISGTSLSNLLVECRENYFINFACVTLGFPSKAKNKVEKAWEKSEVKNNVDLVSQNI